MFTTVAENRFPNYTIEAGVMQLGFLGQKRVPVLLGYLLSVSAPGRRWQQPFPLWRRSPRPIPATACNGERALVSSVMTWFFESPHQEKG